MKDKILIIDDEKEFIQKISKELNHSFDLTAYHSPYTFLKDIEQEILKDLKLILIDLHMPGIDGLTLIQKIKESYGQLPALVILTSYDNQSNRISSYQKNVFDFMNKSITSEEMIIRIKNAIKINEKSRIYNNNSLLGQLTYDAESMTFKISGDELDLTKIESRILYCLFTLNYINKEKTEVIKQVWAGRKITSQTFRSHIFNLNTKLKPYSVKIFIHENGKVYFKEKN